jgi:hypothetical protein
VSTSPHDDIPAIEINLGAEPVGRLRREAGSAFRGAAILGLEMGLRLAAEAFRCIEPVARRQALRNRSGRVPFHETDS